VSKYFFPFAPACSGPRVAPCLPEGKSSINRWLMTSLSDCCRRKLGNRAIIGSSASTARAFGDTASRGLLPRVYTKSRQRRTNVERHSVSLISDRGKEKVVQIRMGQRKSNKKRHFAPACSLELLQGPASRSAQAVTTAEFELTLPGVVAQPPFSMIDRRSHEETFWSSTNFADASAWC